MSSRTNRDISKAKQHEMSGRDFEALPRGEREKIIADIEAKTPEQHLAESRPLTRAERAQWKQYKRRGSAGRPLLGPRGVKVISLSVEQSLLQRADAFAKSHGMKRSEFFSQAILAAMTAK